MRSKAFYTYVSLFFLSFTMHGQETISVGTTEGCDSLEVSFVLETALRESDYTSIEWNFGDGGTAEGSLAVTHLYTGPGTFVTTCTLNGTNIITADEPVVVASSPFTEIMFRDTSRTDSEFTYLLYPAYYNAGAGDSLAYRWTLPDMSESSDSTVVYQFPEEGLYPVSLEVISRNGCSYLASRTIPVSAELLVPNVFSPNGDRVNDIFRVSTQGEFVYETRIFTRNGIQVFYSESRRIEWDGRTSSGQEAPPGVYYYVIRCDQTPEETRRSGTLYLYR